MVGDYRCNNIIIIARIVVARAALPAGREIPPRPHTSPSPVGWWVVPRAIRVSTRARDVRGTGRRRGRSSYSPETRGHRIRARSSLREFLHKIHSRSRRRGFAGRPLVPGQQS